MSAVTEVAVRMPGKSSVTSAKILWKWNPTVTTISVVVAAVVPYPWLVLSGKDGSGPVK